MTDDRDQATSEATSMRLRAWTEQLYKEYENVVFQYRVRLRSPLLCFAEGRGTWGRWDPLERSITLNADLPRKYAWDVVVEVLKHEMAHQYVTDHWGHDHTHGEAFHEACDRLGVLDWARRASGDLPDEIPHWKDRGLSPEEERLMQKVEKLLSLGQSDNEHEAFLAMQKVHELYARHNIDRLRNQRSSEMVYLVMTRKRKRMEATESVIYSILTEHFFVQAIVGNQYDAVDMREYRVAELLGTRENVLMAEYVYHFLWNQIHSLWRSYKTATGRSGHSKRSYQLGVLSGFRKKLEKAGAVTAEEEENLNASERALIKKGTDPQLEGFVAQRHPRLVTGRYTSGRYDDSSYRAGYSAGQKLNLHKGLSRQDGNRGRLLPG